MPEGTAEMNVAGTPRVALLIETARGYGRGLLRGIVRYARLHGPWAFYVTPGDFEQMLPKMRQWDGTGIIARIETPRVARAILQSGLPTIALGLSRKQLRPGSPLAGLSHLASDSFGAAAMAAEHLLERHFRHYAFVGVAGRVWSDERQEGFCRRIREAGFEPIVYPAPARPRQHSWAREQSALARWLAALPKPAGVMACNDDRGREVLEACRAAGVRVPEDLAVVGVDNDELLCELAEPPLSSVVLNAEQGGYRAAELLDRMMRGEVSEPRRLFVEPLCAVTRRSSDIVAVDDTEVAAALRAIHAGAGSPIRINELVERLHISRRALEMRFHKALGRTIHEEIERVRLDRAKRLLVESDFCMPRIAAMAGYQTASYLGQLFRRRLGMTPSQYRRWVRDGQPPEGRPERSDSAAAATGHDRFGGPRRSRRADAAAPGRAARGGRRPRRVRRSGSGG